MRAIFVDQPTGLCEKALLSKILELTAVQIFQLKHPSLQLSHQPKSANYIGGADSHLNKRRLIGQQNNLKKGRLCIEQKQRANKAVFNVQEDKRTHR